MNDSLFGTIVGGDLSPAGLAVESITRMETWVWMFLVVAGLIFLLLGVKLIRPICTIVLAACGFYAGLLAMGQPGDLLANAAKLPAPAVIGFTVGLVLGCMLYRLWIMLGFGLIVAVVTAGVWFVVSCPDEFRGLRDQSSRIYSDVSPLLPALHSESELAALEHLNDPEKLRQSGASPEQLEMARTLKETLPAQTKELWAGVVQSFNSHQSGLSIWAGVGLIGGTLFAGFAWRLSVILVTSIFGAGLLTLGAWGMVSRVSPESLVKLQDWGDLVWCLPLGLCLAGILVQWFQSRPKAQPETENSTPTAS